ncbi:hypothetical protein [Streptomyces sp. NBC_00197]|uniref:hypothetical protein n=1 Tax=Streptomyces sp. NBC_00197 TaxID=2975676 RepID=UPI00324462CE
MANGPGGTEVGRVYIRVLPNTAEFAAKLKAAIKGMSDEVEVGVTANTAKAEAKIKAIGKKAEITLDVDASTKKAEAKLKLIDDKKVVIQARALTEKAAAELDALTNRRRNLNIRVDAITSAAAAKMAALDKKRDVTIEAHLNDQSIAKAEARIQALDRRRDLVLSLDTKQVTKRYNRLKAQMRHLTSQLDIQTDPEALVRIRAQLAEVSRGFKLIGDIKLRGREEVVATLEALKKRYQVIIEARSAQVDRTLAKIDSEMQALREKSKIHLQAVFDGAKAKGEYEAWEKSLKAQALKVSAALDTAKATVDWETYKALLENYRVQINADLDTARASTDAAVLKQRIEALRAKISVVLDEKSAANVQARIDIMSRDYKFHLNAKLEDAAAKISIEQLAKDRKVYFKAVLDTKKAMVQFAELDHKRVAQIHVELSDSLKAQAELAALGRDRIVELKAEMKKSAKLEAELDFLTRDRTIHIKVKKSWKSKILAGLTNEINTAGRQTGILSGIFRNLGGVIAKVAQGITGVAAIAIGKTTAAMGGAGEGLAQLGQQMASAATEGMGSMVLAGAKSAAVLAVLATLAGVAVAVFAGLAAAILAVVAALLGMVLAVAMLAVVLVGAALGAVALAALPIAFIAGAGLMLAKSKELNKEFNKLKQTFKDVVAKAARPMIKEFQKELPKLRKWLWSMEDDFQGAFKAASKHLEDFRIGIQNFVKNILPGLTKGMNSANFGKFTKAFSSALGDIGKSIGASFNILAQNGDKFAGVITEIGRGLGVVLPGLARFLSALATNAHATGKFADGVAAMFDELATTFERALGSAGWGKTVEGIANMFQKLGHAIGHGFEVAMKHGDDFKRAFESFGDFFDQLSGPLAEFTGSAAGQFADVMPSVTDGMIQITKSMQKFTESFAKFAPEVVTQISDAIAGLFDYLARPDVAKACQEITLAFLKFAREALGPKTLDAILNITDGVTQLLALIGPLLPYIIQLTSSAWAFKLIADLIRQLVQWWNELSPAISDAKDAIVGWITEALPIVIAVWDAISNAASIAWTAVMTVVGIAIEYIKLAVSTLVAAIGIYWMLVWTAVQIVWNLVLAVIQSVIAIIVGIFQVFIGLITTGWHLLTGVVSAVWNLIVSIIKGVINILVGYFQIFVGIITGDWGKIRDGASSVWKGIQGIVSGVLNFLKSLANSVASAVTGSWRKIQSAATGAWNGIRSAFSSAMSGIKSAVSDAVSYILGKLNSVKDKAGSILSKLNPANLFSAALDVDVNLNMSGSLPKALSVPVGYDSPSAGTFSSLTADNNWRQDVSTMASGVDQANNAFNSSLAIAGMLDTSSSNDSSTTARRGVAVTVNAETNADPNEIGREVAWALRRK